MKRRGAMKLPVQDEPRRDGHLSFSALSPLQATSYFEKFQRKRSPTAAGAAALSHAVLRLE